MDVTAAGRPPKPDPRLELVKFPGLGIKRANALYEQGIRSTNDLKRKDIYPKLPLETQLNLKYPVDRKLPWDFVDGLVKVLPDGVMVLGSYRRRRPIVGDVDMLTTRPLPEVIRDLKKVIDIVGEFATGDKRYAAIAKWRGRYFHIDLFNCSPQELPTAILHWTGSLLSNIKLRTQAIKLGMMLNQYGLYKGDQRIPVSSEEDIFSALGLEYKPPEHREK